MKANKNRRQLGLGQRTYYAAAGHDTNQAINMTFETLYCPITNTSKNNSVSGSANKIEVIVNKIVYCFASFASPS